MSVAATFYALKEPDFVIEMKVLLPYYHDWTWGNKLACRGGSFELLAWTMLECACSGVVIEAGDLPSSVTVEKSVCNEPDSSLYAWWV